MTYHNTEFPKIGESTEHAAPALRRSLSDKDFEARVIGTFGLPPAKA